MLEFDLETICNGMVIITTVSFFFFLVNKDISMINYVS